MLLWVLGVSSSVHTVTCPFQSVNWKSCPARCLLLPINFSPLSTVAVIICYFFSKGVKVWPDFQNTFLVSGQETKFIEVFTAQQLLKEWLTKQWLKLRLFTFLCLVTSFAPLFLSPKIHPSGKDSIFLKARELSTCRLSLTTNLPPLKYCDFPISTAETAKGFNAMDSAAFQWLHPVQCWESTYAVSWHTTIDGSFSQLLKILCCKKI